MPALPPWAILLRAPTGAPAKDAPAPGEDRAGRRGSGWHAARTASLGVTLPLALFVLACCLAVSIWNDREGES